MELLQVIAALCGGIAAIASLVNAVVVMRIKVEVSQLRTEISEDRRQDEQSMQTWVEQRFVRRQQGS